LRPEKEKNYKKQVPLHYLKKKPPYIGIGALPERSAWKNDIKKP